MPLTRHTRGGHPRHRRHRPLVGAAGVAFAALAGVVGGGLTPQSAAAVQPDFVCGDNTVYSVASNTGVITRLDIRTGAASPNGTFAAGTSVNALALGPGGSSLIWGFDGNTGQVALFDAATETTERFPFPGLVPSSVAGAIDRTTGVYYFGGLTSGGTWQLHAFDTNTRTAIGAVASVSVPGVNGDMAFDSAGDLYIVSNNGAGDPGSVVRLPGPIPTTAGTVSLTPTLVTALSGSFGLYAAVAFDSSGELIVGSVGIPDTYLRVNPTDGTILGQFPGPRPFDLASCASPRRVRVQVNLPAGRVRPSDQFAVEAQGATGSPIAGTTNGADPGVQGEPAETAGPVLGEAGSTFTIGQAGTPGTDLTLYDQTWECVDAADGNRVVAAGTGDAGSVTLPSTGVGADVLCIFTNVPKQPSLQLVRSASPEVFAAASTTITYTFTVSNSGQVPLSGLVVTDPFPGLSPLTCAPVALGGELAVGQNTTCQATYLTSQVDLDGAPRVNRASASATAPSGSSVTAAASATITPQPPPPPTTPVAALPPAPADVPPTTVVFEPSGILPETGRDVVGPLSLLAALAVTAGGALMVLSRRSFRRG